MESNSTPPSSQFSPPTLAPKKGLGTGAKIGIGCGALVVLVIIGMVVAGLILGPKFMKFAESAQDNPTRTVATVMVTVGGGQMTLIAEDDEKKRYTVKETSSGALTTIYWDEKTQAPAVISGDFSAIPAGKAEIPLEVPPEITPTPELQSE